MGSRIGRHLRSQFVGYIALVLAMSGTAYAVGRNSIGDRELAKNSVGSSEIEQHSVKGEDLGRGSVGPNQLGSELPFCWTGEILQVGFNFAPEGTYPADGGTVQIRQEPALYSLYGNRFGGDGTTTFGLPNIKSTDGTMFVICGRDGYFPPRP